MKYIKFFLSLALLLGLLHVLNYPQQVGEDNIPPIGHFFNPFQGFWQNAESFAESFGDEKIEVPNRKNKIKVVFDDRMVPHIFADNMEDAAFAQGYVLAKMRLWQMDMLSRLSAGRLSEVMGENVLEIDKLQRRRGMLYGATQANEAWKEYPETYDIIQAYADGVNAWVQNMPEGQKPLEFKLLDYLPESWSPLRSALVKKYMELTLCSAETDLESTNARTILGPGMFEKLYPEWNPKQSPIIPKGTKWDFPPLPPNEVEEVQEAMSSLIHQMPYEKPSEGVGSNNWAVSGTKTESGNPILCNDPHLQLALPSIWFEIQIHTPETNVYGVAIPGMPGIVIGFNEHVAWGFTNVGQDVVDWYEMSWKDDSKMEYILDGNSKEVKVVEEVYHVKNKTEPIIDKVKWTDWGPIVYEGDADGKRDMAMRWIAHDKPNFNDFASFLGLNHARNYNDYRKSAMEYGLPAQNFAFASNGGDIAMTVNGLFPKKRNQQGRFVQKGNDSQNAWMGFIPKSQVPYVKNPERGFISSTNQHSTDPSYPYYYNARGFDDYRGRYLNRELERMEKITVEDMMKLQNSNHSLLAEEGLPQLIKYLNLDELSEREKDIVDKLAVWDFKYDAEKVEPAIFETWWDNVYDSTFDEIVPWKDSIAMLLPEDWVLVSLLEESPGDSIFDHQETTITENARNVIYEALKKTLDDMSEELLDPSFDWSKRKGTSVTHLTRIAPFSRRNLNVGGTGLALNAMKGNHGPSWRMIVDLGDEVKGWGVFPGGQSGNPGSPYYTSELEKWRKGEYNELFFMKDENDASNSISFTLEIN